MGILFGNKSEVKDNENKKDDKNDKDDKDDKKSGEKDKKNKPKELPAKPKKEPTEEDIKNYLTIHNIFPSFLKSNNIENFSLVQDGLNEVKYEHIKKERREECNQVIQKNKDYFNLEDEKKFVIQIMNNKNDLNFLINNTNETNEKYIKGIYKTFLFHIQQKDLSLTQEYEDNIKKIISQNSQEEKPNKLKIAKELFQLFEEKGYFIPLSIYVGGVFIKSQEKAYSKRKNTKNNETTAPYKSSNSTITYKNEKFTDKTHSCKVIQIIGGDPSLDDIDQWKASVELSNSQVIECKEIIPITEILKDELKTQLSNEIKMIDIYFILLEEYYKIINITKEINLEGIHKIGTFSSFNKMHEQDILNSPLIDCRVYFFNEKVQVFGYNSRNITKSFDDIIVGIKIIDTKPTWRSNGEWTIRENPLLTKNIHLYFESKLWSTQNYFIIVYILKYPEIKEDNQSVNSTFDLEISKIKVGNMKNKNIEIIIEDHFKKNNGSGQVEKILEGKNFVEVYFSPEKELDPDVKINCTQRAMKDVLEIHRKKLKKIYSK